jgi:hypothetical protein
MCILLLLKPFYTPPAHCIMFGYEFAKAVSAWSAASSKQSPEFIRRQSCAFGNRTHRDCINGIVAWNDEPLFAVGHHDVSALPGNVVAELFKNADGVTLADARNFWHNSNGNKFAGETRALGFGFAPGIFFSDFEPELDGFADVGQRLVMRRPLAVATRQSGTGNGKTFFGLNHDYLILHGSKILWLKL